MIQAPAKAKTIYDRFFAKLETNLKEIQNKNIHPSLRDFISKDILCKIYDYLIINRKHIEVQLIQQSVNQRLAYRCRNPTERAIQIVQDIDGELILLLETKSKLCNKQKGNRATIYSKRKKIKVCWRIETLTPEKWKGIILKSHEVEVGIKGAFTSQQLFRDNKKQTSNLPYVIQPSLIGSKYKDKKTNEDKVTLYMPYSYTFDEMIANEWLYLKEKDVQRITACLLNAIKLVHKNRKVFQRINTENVLVFEDEKGYHVKLSGFERVVNWGEGTAAPSAYFESPETRFGYKNDYSNYGNYYRHKCQSYGAYLYNKHLLIFLSAIQSECIKATPENDMWALGILLFSLFTGQADFERYTEIEGYPHPLIKGLLNVKGADRFTIKEASKCFKSTNLPLKKRMHNIPIQHLLPKVKRLIGRIQERVEFLRAYDLDVSLRPFIDKSALFLIYDFYLSQAAFLPEILANAFSLQQNVTALRKPPNQKLQRATQIVEDVNGELVLLLETKSKTADNTKGQVPVFQGGSKKSKPCWRIDLPKPQEWISAVVISDNILKAIEGALLSIKLCKEAIPTRDIPFPILPSCIGSIYLNSRAGLRKIALYSPRAKGYLYQALFENWRFTENDLIRMSKGLLYALKIMHAQKLAHQDIHGGNLLLFQDQEGFYLCMIDFDLAAEFGSLKAQASVEGVPPELFLAYPKNHYLAELYHANLQVYGAYLFKIGIKTGLFPSPADAGNIGYQQVEPTSDIFQAGMIFYMLYTGTLPQNIVPHYVAVYNNVLVQGMLRADKNQRFTINEALQALEICKGKLTATYDQKLSPALSRFFQRLEERAVYLKANPLFADLVEYITQEDLLNIYCYLLDRREKIIRHLTRRDPQVIHHYSLALRLGKKAGLPRTVHIIDNQAGELLLILETKSKSSNGHKIINPEQKVDAWKKNQLCWRIDCSAPEAWWSIGTRGYKQINAFLKMINNFQRFYQANRGLDEDVPPAFNQFIFGEIYFSHNQARIVVFTQRAICDLKKVITEKERYRLTAYECNRMLKGIMLAFKTIHVLKYVYQDLKLHNILVFKDAKGYYIKLSESVNLKACGEPDNLAINHYEPPELHIAYPLGSKHYSYFNSKTRRTYGRYLYSQMPLSQSTQQEILELQKAAPETDMWSLGIVMYCFTARQVALDIDFKKLAATKHPLIQGLLAPKPEDRLNINNALKLFEDLSLANESDTPLEEGMEALQLNSYTPGFQGQRASNRNCSRPAEERATTKLQPPPPAA